MFASLVTLDGFHLLLSVSTQLTADGSMFHPLSHIYAKTLFCCVETVANNALNGRCIVLINCEQAQHPLWTQLSHLEMFMQNSEYTAFWHLQLLCYLTQLQFMFGQNNNCQIWATWEFSIISICMTTFKVSMPPLNHLFVAASHQTRLDTGSKAQRPIKVGIKGRGGRERVETQTLLVYAAHRLTWCNVSLMRQAVSRTQMWVQACMPVYALN